MRYGTNQQRAHRALSKSTSQDTAAQRKAKQGKARQGLHMMSDVNTARAGARAGAGTRAGTATMLGLFMDHQHGVRLVSVYLCLCQCLRLHVWLNQIMHMGKKGRVRVSDGDTVCSFHRGKGNKG